MNKSIIKLIGMGVTMIGMGATLMSNWVDDQKMKQEVKDEVNRAITQREKEEES